MESANRFQVPAMIVCIHCFIRLLKIVYRVHYSFFLSMSFHLFLFVSFFLIPPYLLDAHGVRKILQKLSSMATQDS